MKVVADLMDINKSTLSRYETNSLPISDDIIQKFARALRIKEAKLMFDCLCHIQPKLKNSPFGQLFKKLIKSTSHQSY